MTTPLLVAGEVTSYNTGTCNKLNFKITKFHPVQAVIVICDGCYVMVLSKTPVTLKAHDFLVVRFLNFLGGRGRRPKILRLKP